MSADLIVKMDATGFLYHAPAVVYHVEFRVAGENGQRWGRVWEYGDKGQAEKLRDSLIAGGRITRIRAVKQK